VLPMTWWMPWLSGLIIYWEILLRDRFNND
jgi:hypothetical protein